VADWLPLDEVKSSHEHMAGPTHPAGYNCFSKFQCCRLLCFSRSVNDITGSQGSRVKTHLTEGSSVTCWTSLGQHAVFSYRNGLQRERVSQMLKSETCPTVVEYFVNYDKLVNIRAQV